MPVSVAMPKQAMKPDLHGHAIAMPGEPEEKHAADQRLGHGHHHQHGVHEIVVGQIQDHEDQNQHQRQDEPHRAVGPNLVLELSAPFQVHSVRQSRRDFLVH